MTHLENLPGDVRARGRFCCYRREKRDGTVTKVPYNARTGGRARSNDPATFTDFKTAMDALPWYDGLGVGIFDGICAIDIDHCVGPDGALSQLAADVAERFGQAGAYVEHSPSGTGVHILFRAPGFAYDAGRYYINRQKLGLEVYVCGATHKYVTVTGNAIRKADALPDCGGVLRAVLERYMRREDGAVAEPLELVAGAQPEIVADADIIQKAMAGRGGDRMRALWAGDTSGYPSHSEADLALCNLLTYWTDGDAARVDRLFRTSGLMRPKWDRVQSGSTYGWITIGQSIRSWQAGRGGGRGQSGGDGGDRGDGARVQSDGDGEDGARYESDRNASAIPAALRMKTAPAGTGRRIRPHRPAQHQTIKDQSTNLPNNTPYPKKNLRSKYGDPKGVLPLWPPEAVPTPSSQPPDIAARLALLAPEHNERYSWSDLGGGNLYADVFKDTARYVPERKRWYVYDGIRWRPDVGDLWAMALCKQLASALVRYAAERAKAGGASQAGHGADAYVEYARGWRKRQRREIILKDAAGVHPMHVEALDADPFLLNCLNGTLNLQTGAFAEHRSEDLLSRVAAVQYDPAARCARWERFIGEVMQEDAGKAAFLQKALGYALTGDTRHECFFILYGPTSRNGKGTAMETYMRMMGDYGRSAGPDTIAQRQAAGGSGPSEDIARLAGARFVNISEPDQRLVLSAALVKTLTGRDLITARFLHENSFEYRPQFKLFINTNHLPKVTDVTLFASDRVKLIPFERHFDKTERDEALKDTLCAPQALSGILNWCIDGLRLLQTEGFDMPDSVRDATEDYRDKSDKLGLFLADEMVKEVGAEARTEDAYRRYTRWCEKNGFHAENAANFKGMMGNVAKVVKKRPVGGGSGASPQMMIVGYRMKYDTYGNPMPPTPRPVATQQTIYHI